mmetsp:Transcript_1806/g.4197  ORF Transcript_1806/g.4197 Transcript_1806/m.4197 type:complete len:518 (-) Transcript_1806:304-1857(-)
MSSSSDLDPVPERRRSRPAHALGAPLDLRSGAMSLGEGDYNDEDDEAAMEALRKRRDISQRALSAVMAGSRPNAAKASTFLFKAPPLLVLRIDHSGQHMITEMERDELLREARRVVPKLTTRNGYAVPVKTKEELLSSLGSEADDTRNYDNSISSASRSGNATNGDLADDDDDTVENDFRSDAGTEQDWTVASQAGSAAMESLPAFMKLDARETPKKLTYRGTLQPRDIRLFDPAFSNTHDPEILARRHATLLNLDPLKALVLYDKCFIFVPDGSDSLMGNILMRMRELDDEISEMPFEMKVYEAVLATTCYKLEDIYNNLRPAILNNIKMVLKSTRGPILEKLRHVKSRLDNLDARIAAVHKALSELLRSDSDMALMQLTKAHAHPERYLTGNEEDWAFDHDEIELMLENYLQIIDGVQIGIRDLDEDLDSAQSSVSLRLSTAQNKLLGVDLFVSGLTAASTIGALIAGLFGMNLNSGVSEAPYWFWAVFGSTLGFIPVVIFGLVYKVRSQGLLIS